MSVAASAPDAAPADASAVGLVVAESLAACGPAELLARGRGGLHNPSVSRGPVTLKIPAAMALALLKPLRLLDVTGRGPSCVAELPFVHVRAAAATLGLLEQQGADRPLPPSLRDWVNDAGLRSWTIDEGGWRRRRDRSVQQARVVDRRYAAERCAAKVVAAARRTTITAGSADGSEGVELLLGDGSAVTLPCDEPAPGRLTGTTITVAVAVDADRWYFRGSGYQTDYTFDVGTATLWQPSPFAA